MEANTLTSSTPTVEHRRCSIQDFPTETLQMIFSFVSQRNFIKSKCSPVCKSWNATSKFFLWRSIGFWFWPKFQRDPIFGATILSKHCQYIHELNVCNEYLIEHLFVHDTLRLWSESYPRSQFQDFVDRESIVLTNLRHLRVACKLDLSTKSPSAKDMVRNLQEFRISFAMDPHSAKLVLGHLPESIREAQVVVHRRCQNLPPAVDQISDGEPEANYYEMASSASRPRPNLRSLTITGNFKGSEEYVLLPFLTTCSNLKNFQNPETDCFRPKELRAALVQLGESLERLCPRYLPQGKNSADSEIATAIAQHQRLDAVDLTGCKATGPLPPRLSSTVGSVSNDLIAAPWSSPSLESFICQIKVPRSDDDVPAEVADPIMMRHASAEHCHEVQRAVYHQISLHTKLRSLSLGYSGWTDFESVAQKFQWNSLEMTLQSGMDKLATLKELNMLRLRNMNHNLGILELEWMVEH
ncbi:hypothetical protein BG000_011697 [Podila horticola]|nr:hypothetical protein BG000_011697 [Podila horticola]